MNYLWCNQEFCYLESLYSVLPQQAGLSGAFLFLFFFSYKVRNLIWCCYGLFLIFYISRLLKNSSLIESEKEPKEVLEIQSSKIEESKDKKVDKADFSNYNEVKLTNLSFGYNEESKDFFIKVKRGDFEAQYPTDEMMRLKAHLSDVANKANDSKSGFEAS